MTKPIVTLDVDGVLAGGGYIPADERRPEVYAKLPLLEDITVSAIHKIARDYTLYAVSSRSFPEALKTTETWLSKKGGISRCFSGVLVNIDRWLKAPLVRIMGSICHIDDDPLVMEMASQGILMSNPAWPMNQAAVGKFQTINSLAELPAILERRIKNPSPGA